MVRTQHGTRAARGCSAAERSLASYRSTLATPVAPGYHLCGTPFEPGVKRPGRAGLGPLARAPGFIDPREMAGGDGLHAQAHARYVVQSHRGVSHGSVAARGPVRRR